jgi:flagellar FliJ protein
MSIIKSVFIAIDLATAHLDQAGSRLLDAQRADLFAQDQMAQLTVYADETEARWRVAAQLSTTPELMRHHYQFMDRLQHAIGLQSGVLEEARQRVDAAKKMSINAEIKLASLKLALGKKQADLAVVQSRREQKQMDEFAAMRTWQTIGGNFVGSDCEH